MLDPSGAQGEAEGAWHQSEEVIEIERQEEKEGSKCTKAASVFLHHLYERTSRAD